MTSVVDVQCCIWPSKKKEKKRSDLPVHLSIQGLGRLLSAFGFLTPERVLGELSHPNTAKIRNNRCVSLLIYLLLFFFFRVHLTRIQPTHTQRGKRAGGRLNDL